MEEAEHDFLRNAGLPLFQPHEAGQVSWPRVSATCDFKSPARFEDILDITVSVHRIGRRSVTYGFHLTCKDTSVAEGRMTSACCLVGHGKIESVDIPDTTRTILARYLSSSVSD